MKLYLARQVDSFKITIEASNCVLATNPQSVSYEELHANEVRAHKCILTVTVHKYMLMAKLHNSRNNAAWHR